MSNNNGWTNQRVKDCYKYIDDRKNATKLRSASREDFEDSKQSALMWLIESHAYDATKAGSLWSLALMKAESSFLDAKRKGRGHRPQEEPECDPGRFDAQRLAESTTTTATPEDVLLIAEEPQKRRHRKKIAPH